MGPILKKENKYTKSKRSEPNFQDLSTWHSDVIFRRVCFFFNHPKGGNLWPFSASSSFYHGAYHQKKSIHRKWSIFQKIWLLLWALNPSENGDRVWLFYHCTRLSCPTSDFVTNTCYMTSNNALPIIYLYSLITPQQSSILFIVIIHYFFN